MSNATANNIATALVSTRAVLLHLDVVRIVRGCDSESVLRAVCDATHPQWLRWVFNLAVDPTRRNRSLRFWKDELTGTVEKSITPAVAIEKILGQRREFPRGEIEIQWCLHSSTLARLVRAGELKEANGGLTRASLAAFLKRRLQ